MNLPMSPEKEEGEKRNKPYKNHIEKTRWLTEKGSHGKHGKHGKIKLCESNFVQLYEVPCIFRVFTSTSAGAGCAFRAFRERFLPIETK